jgi:alkylhydroperoxidase family enzyme
LTYEPHRLCDGDINELRKHYTDKQIPEIILHVAGYNSINRWKEGAGIPQSPGGGGFGSRRSGGDNTGAEKKVERPTEANHSYLTPTSPRFQDLITKVVPLKIDEKTGKPSTQTVFRRAPLESRAAVEQSLDAARKRSPRLPLADDVRTKGIVPDGFSDGSLAQWTRLLAIFPNSAKSRIASIHSAETRGDLKPLLKAQISWIVARQDRAWYALGQARRRLHEQGWSDDEIFKLDGDWSEFTPAERAQFQLARQLEAAPIVLTDAETAEALKQVGPRDVVQLISYTTNRVSFNRITEAAGLRLED